MKRIIFFALFHFLTLPFIYAQSSYEAIEIVPETGNFEAAAINNFGQVAGNIVIDQAIYHAVRRETDGQFTEMSDLGGNFSVAFGMNQKGDVCGFGVNGSGFAFPGIWENNVFRDVDVPTSAASVPILVDVNDEGLAAGHYFDDAGHAHAVIWVVDGTPQNLPELDGIESFVSGINNKREISGSIKLADGSSKAVLWRFIGFGMYEAIDLGNLGGSKAQTTDINEIGQVLGFSTFGVENITHGFLWDNGEMTELGGPGEDNKPWGFNILGEIVGKKGSPPVPYFLRKDRTTDTYDEMEFIDLSLPGGIFDNAFDINRAGQILVSGQTTGNSGIANNVRLAYVTSINPGNCIPGLPYEPCPNLDAAFNVGATEFRIEAESIFLDGFESGDVGSWSAEGWNGKTGPEEDKGSGKVTFMGDFTVTPETTAWLTGTENIPDLIEWVFAADVDIQGILNVMDSGLEINADFGDNQLTVGENGNIIGTGLIKFTGGDNTRVEVHLDPNVLNIFSEEFVVSKSGEGIVTLNASDIGGENNPNVIQFGSFSIGPFGTVELGDNIDEVNIENDYIQSGGKFQMSGTPSGGTKQKVKVGGDMIMEDGEFSASGGDVEVFGDFLMGQSAGEEPGDALFNLEFNGTHTVIGDFKVGTDTNSESENVEDRNSYNLSKASLFLFGDVFDFQGTGDKFNDLDFLPGDQGLEGEVIFMGAQTQFVTMRQDEDANLNDVIISGEGGIRLQSDVTQNNTGTLTLENGIIDTDKSDWILADPGPEQDLIGRNNSDRGMGVVDLGSRDSYIDGAVTRTVEFGNTTDGVVTGGYLFPVGVPVETEPAGDRDVDFFRPLILQFPDDLGRSGLARVDYREDLTDQDFVYDELEVDILGGRKLRLDAVGSQFWQLEFDRIPAFDPNIRVLADGLPHVQDIESLRLVQWNCDGTNPRLAGTYPVDNPNPDVSAITNDFIDDILNITQEGVTVDLCQILGIATNGFMNAINQSLEEDPLRTQIINNSSEAGVLQPSIDGRQIPFSLDSGDGTLFGFISGGEKNLEFKNEAGEIIITPITVSTDHIAIADGPFDDNFKVFVKNDARPEANDPAKVDITAFHGNVDLPPLDIQLITEGQALELGSQVAYGDFTDYLSFESGVVRISIMGSRFVFDLSEKEGESLLILITPTIASDGGRVNQDDFGVAIIDAKGSKTEPAQIITGIEDPLSSNHFVLNENYPNPFKGTTRIEYNLSEQANVRLGIYDLLGQPVKILVDAKKPAGKYSLEWDGSDNIGNHLPGGVYLYRMEADNRFGSPFVKTHKMILLK